MEEYNGDYYAWLNATALALEEGRLNDVNRVQVAEELRDIGKSERRRIESYFERLLAFMLTIEYQPGKHTRSWDYSIETSRVRLRKLFRENPSLAADRNELMLDSYETARLEAARQTGLALELFPVECPFSLPDVLP